MATSRLALAPLGRDALAAQSPEPSIPAARLSPFQVLIGIAEVSQPLESPAKESVWPK